ncbi:hypothetical protein LMG10661_03815 [Ralstonia syzygii subsp. syzygii]|nr:hypothetical protein LMG10661_03815 [Ralstonia syzygii subsp. syzygii]
MPRAGDRIYATTPVKDVHVAQQVLAAEGFRFMQAPLAPGAATTSQTQANDSEMLMALGYSSSALLAGLVNG